MILWIWKAYVHSNKLRKHYFYCYQKKPYAEISTAEITRKAEVSRASFYRNYENKDDVLSQFLANQYQKFINDLHKHQVHTLKDQLAIYLEFF